MCKSVKGERLLPHPGCPVSSHHSVHLKCVVYSVYKYIHMYHSIHCIQAGLASHPQTLILRHFWSFQVSMDYIKKFQWNFKSFKTGFKIEVLTGASSHHVSWRTSGGVQPAALISPHCWDNMPGTITSVKEVMKLVCWTAWIIFWNEMRSNLKSTESWLYEWDKNISAKSAFCPLWRSWKVISTPLSPPHTVSLVTVC